MENSPSAQELIDWDFYPKPMESHSEIFQQGTNRLGEINKKEGHLHIQSRLMSGLRH